MKKKGKKRAKRISCETVHSSNINREKDIKNHVSVPSLIAASITGATGGVVLGSVLASAPGAIIGAMVGSAITWLSSYEGQKNKETKDGKTGISR